MPTRLLAAFGLLFVLGAAAAADLVSDAKAFMQAYAQDLNAGDRQAVADRYARRGAIMVSGGQREVLSFEQLRADYVIRWQPPVAFEWRSLAYEAVGDRAVFVTGEFVWKASRDKASATFGYVGLLVLEDGRLRIRLEDETRQAGAASQP